jgi:hypothetical protein
MWSRQLRIRLISWRTWTALTAWLDLLVVRYSTPLLCSESPLKKLWRFFRLCWWKPTPNAWFWGTGTLVSGWRQEKNSNAPSTVLYRIEIAESNSDVSIPFQSVLFKITGRIRLPTVMHSSKVLVTPEQSEKHQEGTTGALLKECKLKFAVSSTS